MQQQSVGQQAAASSFTHTDGSWKGTGGPVGISGTNANGAADMTPGGGGGEMPAGSHVYTATQTPFGI